MIPQRILIRHYLEALLKAEVDVGERVFTSRANSPLFLEELPAINIHFGNEQAEVSVGDEYHVKTYTKYLEVFITVTVENQVSIDADFLDNHKGQDYLDYLSASVEQAFNDDMFFARRLETFEADSSTEGLINGNKLTGILPYDSETESSTACISQVLRYTLPYTSDASGKRRLKDFDSFYNGIVKVGRTEQTVDPILMEMEGTL